MSSLRGASGLHEPRAPLLIAVPAFSASHQAQQLTNVLKPRRQYEPVVHALLVNGERRCRKRRVSKGTDRDSEVLLPPFYGVVHGGSADGTKAKGDPAPLVAYAEVGRCFPAYVYIVLREARL